MNSIIYMASIKASGICGDIIDQWLLIDDYLWGYAILKNSGEWAQSMTEIRSSPSSAKGWHFGLWTLLNWFPQVWPPGALRGSRSLAGILLWKLRENHLQGGFYQRFLPCFDDTGSVCYHLFWAIDFLPLIYIYTYIYIDIYIYIHIYKCMYILYRYICILIHNHYISHHITIL